ncbi:MAG: hypothetical protein JWP35_386 [Caulobacter sp.]|nr:hypothetical protein [Caulobacter sp.]
MPSRQTHVLLPIARWSSLTSVNRLLGENSLSAADSDSPQASGRANDMDAAERRRRAFLLTLNFVLAQVESARRLDGDDLVTTLVFIAVTQANVGHVDEDPALFGLWGQLEQPVPDELRRPVSGYATALALGLPRETVRRKINGLMARGLLLSAPGGGIYSPAAVLAHPGMMSYAHDAVAAARAFFLRLHALGEVTSQQVEEAETRPALPRMTARAVTSFVMAALEPIQRLAGGELTTGLVLAAIASANAELRGPVTALALSERLGLARETTRRHVGRLTTQGLAAATSRGVMARPAVMEGARVQGAYERICGRRDTLLQRLTLAGILSRAPPPS